MYIVPLVLFLMMSGAQDQSGGGAGGGAANGGGRWSQRFINKCFCWTVLTAVHNAVSVITVQWRKILCPADDCIFNTNVKIKYLLTWLLWIFFFFLISGHFIRHVFDVNYWAIFSSLSYKHLGLDQIDAWASSCESYCCS